MTPDEAAKEMRAKLAAHEPARLKGVGDGLLALDTDLERWAAAIEGSANLRDHWLADGVVKCACGKVEIPVGFALVEEWILGSADLEVEMHREELCRVPDGPGYKTVRKA